jgi:hypothetical protein
MQNKIQDYDGVTYDQPPNNVTTITKTCYCSYFLCAITKSWTSQCSPTTIAFANSNATMIITSFCFH